MVNAADDRQHPPAITTTQEISLVAVADVPDIDIDPSLGLCESCQAITIDKLHLEIEYVDRPHYCYGPRILDLPGLSLVCRFCRLVYMLCKDYVEDATMQQQNCQVELIATTSQNRDFRTEVILGKFAAGAGTGGALSGFLVSFRTARQGGGGKSMPSLQYDPRELRVFVKPDISPPELRRHIAGRVIVAPDSELSYGKVERWIERCLESHADCKRTISGLKINEGATRLPRRVIDLGGSSSPETTAPKLLETKRKQRGKYIALSYCWGGLSPVTTTRETYAAFQRDGGLPFQTLPKTIRDAIAVTRRLGVRYLWVDSLCIIQDDVEDWRRESVNMGRIYQLAFLTIAATGAHDSSEGCFLPRDVSRDEKSCITLPYVDGDDGSPPLGDMYVALPAAFPDRTASHAFSHELREGSWYRRGWVLQERLLSRRIVHFGRHQIFWECNREMVPETGRSSVSIYDPEAIWKAESLIGVRADVGLDPPIEVYQRHPFMRRLSVMMWRVRMPAWIRMAINGPFSSVHWRISVEKYSECNLTMQQDKLPAIEGMAKEIARRTGRKYCAGLWLEDVGRGLFWGADRMPLRRPDQPRAPSWSWAAWNGRITSPARFNILTHATPKRARFLSRDIAVATIPGAQFAALRLSSYVFPGRRTELAAAEYPQQWTMQLSVEGVGWAIQQDAVRSLWSALVEPGDEVRDGGKCVGMVLLDDGPTTAPREFECVVLGGYLIASAQESMFECEPGWYRYCFLAVEDLGKDVYRRLGIGIAAPRDGHADWERKTLTLI